MHMQTEDQVGASHLLQVFDDAFIAHIGIDVLRTPIGEWVRGARYQHEAVLLRDVDHLPPQVIQTVAGLDDGAADARAHLDDRLVHLRLAAFLEPALAFGQQLRLDMRAQVARYRINGLVLLFNAERERWAHSARLQRCVVVRLMSPRLSVICSLFSLLALSLRQASWRRQIW